MRTTIGVLVLLLGTAAATAATAIRASIEQLSTGSVVVVRTRCVSVEARFTDDRRTIETHVELATLETLVGTAPATLTVLCRGGVVGDKALRVPGQATFAPDEEDVLFLRKDSQGSWRVLGWCQGKFKIVRDEKKGTAEAVQELAGLCFVKMEDDGKPVSTKPERLALEELTRRIAAARTPPDGDGTKDEGTKDGPTGERPEEEPPAEDDESEEKADSGKD